MSDVNVRKKCSQKVAPRLTKTNPFVNIAKYLVVTEFCPKET